MRILNRSFYKFFRYVDPGDRLELRYTDGEGKETVVLDELMTRPWKFDAAIIFEVAPGEYDGNVVDGMGGVFLDTGGKGFSDDLEAEGIELRDER